MLFTSKVIALLSALSSAALAADVYSHFLDSSSSQIGTTNFDVANEGCFSVDRASQVSFSQAGSSQTATGPYCLTGFSEGGCAGTTATQQFENVDVTLNNAYQLDQGLAVVGSYKWAPHGC